MKSENDIQLSKMSFTDKDFASLYPDLLDLARTLTNEWDPGRNTNESDPGVVLLKEGAFIADHNNYNIDKNILEAFLPSATQDRSVRNITEMNGYTPRYYVSAVGDITFNYEPEEENNFTPFTIPAYTLVITNEKETIAYTQIEDLIIQKNGLVSVCKFMEGTLNQLAVNTDGKITLENLDENNRLYLPNVYIPQNGVFVRNIDSDDKDLWVRNNYLLTQPLGSKIYKFDFDSSVNLPYIEFPSDIANIIGNGLDVKYISTLGVNGNVSAGTLNKVLSPTTYRLTQEKVVNTSDFSVNNMYSLENGKNPETIDEMYRSFKKIVGTFDTLVTCRDYSNAIYTFEDEYNEPIISNGVVTDIRNDYNHALNVVSYDQYGEYVENVSLCKGITKYKFVTSSSNPELGNIIYTNSSFEVYKEVDGEVDWYPLTELSYADFVDASEAMSPNDLCIYALKSFSMADYLSDSISAALNKSFEPATNDTIDELKVSLSKLKCINHNFMDHDSDEVYCFKNYVPLRLTITPYNKITEEVARTEIYDKVYRALTRYFNAREVEFGEELNYDEVYDVIVNCDDRIKSIRLEDFEYNPVAVKVDKLSGEITETPVYEDSELLVDLVAKNVLAGRLCLFNFDDDFNYEYGQQNVQTYKNIVKVETESRIPLDTQNTEVTSNTTTKEAEFSLTASFSVYDPQNKVNWPVVIGAGETYEIPKDALAIISTVDSSEGVMDRSYITTDSEVISVKNLTSDTWTLEDQTDSITGIASGNIQIIRETTETTSVNNNLNYIIRANEYIQIAFPNYYSTKIYPTYCYYRFFNTVTNDESQNAIARANTEYTLASGEQLVMIYTKDEVQQTDVYGPGTVIRPTFDMYYTSRSSATKVLKSWSYDSISERTDAFVSLSAGQQIEIRELLQTVLNGVNVPCYWIRNNPSNILFDEDDTFVILNSGEYFIYSNSTRDAMVILGAGTKIIKPEGDNTQWKIGNLNSSTVNIASINNEGFSADIKWQVKDFSQEGKELKIQEMNIITLGEGNEIIIQGLDLASSSEIYNDGINNEWQELSPTLAFKLIYTINGSTSTLNYNSSYNYLIRSRLDISVNDLQDQTLLPGQSITITTMDSSEEYIITSDNSGNENTKIQSSVNLDLIGDNSINITGYTNNNIDIGFMSYVINEPTLEVAELAPASGSTVTCGMVYAAASGTSTDGVKYYYTSNGGNTYEEITLTVFNNMWSNTHQNRYNPSTDANTPIGTAFSGFAIYQGTPEDKPLVYNNGRYMFSVSGSSGVAKFPLGYNITYDPTSESQQQYLLPLYLLRGEGGIDINVELIDDDTDTAIPIRDYNYSEPTNSMTLDKGGMYIINPAIVFDSSESSVQDDEQVEIAMNLTLKISWNQSPQDTEAIVLLRPEVVEGINDNLSYVNLGQVLDRIAELLGEADKEVKPYYLHKPDPDMAIQDENILDPKIFWDKNNVANLITIPQIDLDNSDFAITKSMLVRDKKK